MNCNYLLFGVYIYIHIVIKEKTDNIFKVKIFRLRHLLIHNLSLYKFRFESHIRLNSCRGRYKVIQGANQCSASIIRLGNILAITITLK